jgi:hypothetical protein
MGVRLLQRINCLTATGAWTAIAAASMSRINTHLQVAVYADVYVASIATSRPCNPQSAAWLRAQGRRLAGNFLVESEGMDIGCLFLLNTLMSHLMPDARSGRTSQCILSYNVLTLSLTAASLAKRPHHSLIPFVTKSTCGQKDGS